MRELDVDAAGLTDVDGLRYRVVDAMRFVADMGRVTPSVFL